MNAYNKHLKYKLDNTAVVQMLDKHHKALLRISDLYHFNFFVDTKIWCTVVAYNTKTNKYLCVYTWKLETVKKWLDVSYINFVY